MHTACDRMRSRETRHAKCGSISTVFTVTYISSMPVVPAMPVPPSVQSFVDDTEIASDPSGFVPVDQLYNLYVDYCAEEGYPAVHKIGFSRHFQEAVPFQVGRASRTPDGYDKQARGFTGISLEGAPTSTQTVVTSWFCESPGWHDVREFPWARVHVEESGRVAVVVDADAPGTIDLSEILDAVGGEVENLHPVATYLRESDELDPGDYELVRRPQE